MNVQRLTKKSLEAVEAAQNYSRELENMQIEQIHLFWALVQDQEGLIPQLLIRDRSEKTSRRVRSRPGNGQNLYFSKS